MIELLKIIKERRSIRNFKRKELAQSDIDNLLDAIRWAPSWTNSQCWEVIIIKNQEIRKKLQKTLPEQGNPAKKAIIEASLLIALCAKKMVSGFYKGKAATKLDDWLMYDLGIATQNFCLLAHSMGLGTVIVGLFDHDKAKKIIQLPNEYKLITLIPIGYPETINKAPKRRKLEDFTHYDYFGNN